VLDEIVDLLQVARHKTTIAVERSAAEQDTTVRVDRALLTQALLNLVLNAVRRRATAAACCCAFARWARARRAWP
jgi:signal transduction histidine kinase